MMCKYSSRWKLRGGRQQPHNNKLETSKVDDSGYAFKINNDTQATRPFFRVYSGQLQSETMLTATPRAANAERTSDSNPAHALRQLFALVGVHAQDAADALALAARGVHDHRRRSASCPE